MVALASAVISPFIFGGGLVYRCQSCAKVGALMVGGWAVWSGRVVFSVVVQCRFLLGSYRVMRVSCWCRVMRVRWWCCVMCLR
jgi:hypothetical protein